MASSVATTIDALHTHLLALSTLAPLEEYSLAATQGLAINQIRKAISELGTTEAYSVSRPLISLIVDIARRDGIAVADEIVEIATDMAKLGVAVQLPAAMRHKPLASFAKEAALRHTVFVDESGSAAWEEDTQPVLVLVGVLVEDKQIALFDRAVQRLLVEYELDLSTEVHAQPFLSDGGVLKHLEPHARFLFLRRFVELGLRHILGFHYLGMLKPFVTRRFRREAAARGLDAYTAQVLYFNLTLQAACFAKIPANRYRYLFDRTDKYGRDIRSIIGALKQEANDRLRLYGIEILVKSLKADLEMTVLMTECDRLISRLSKAEVERPNAICHWSRVLASPSQCDCRRATEVSKHRIKAC